LTEAEEAKDQLYGHTCLSFLDGSHDGFVRAVQRRIADAESFEHKGTKTWPVSPEGRNTILIQFAARNALGGMVFARAAGSFDNKTCGDVVVDLLE
jgi:hypothetical protein